MGDPDVKDWERLRREIPAIDEKVPDPVNSTDPVNSPNHYLAGSIECIDAIEASASSADAFRGYCKGNVQKYLWRMEHKGKPKEDALKAQWYLNKLISTF